MKKIAQLCVATCLTLTLSSVASAQETDTQTFNVTVPVALSIAAPSASETITHDETDDNQAFAPQQWDVTGNPGAGMDISFATAAPFVHATDATQKADVQLALSVGDTTGGTFTVTNASDTTSFVNSNDTASVAAQSDGPGTAELNLVVTFITDAFTDLAAGTYSTTVTGTISAR